MIIARSQPMDITWQQCITNVRDGSYFYDICNFNNGFIVVHDIYQANTDSVPRLDIWLAFLDSAGNQVWERTIGGSSGDVPHLVLPIDNEFFYLIGESYSNDGNITCEIDPEHGDVWIAKINSTGEIIWQNCYGCASYDDPRAAIVTPDKGLLVMTRIWEGGGDVSNHYGMYDNWLVKLDSIGTIEWETTLGSPERDNGHQLLYTSFNTYIALCAVGGNGGVSECTLMNDPEMGKDVWLVELDLDGNIINQECYGGSKHDLSWDIVETEVGYTILSKTQSSDHDVSGLHGESDFWLLGLDYDRNILWQRCLGGSSYDSPKFLTYKEDGTYIVIGQTQSISGDVSGNHSLVTWDIWVVNADSVGDVIWQRCIGTTGDERLNAGNTIAKKDNYTYTIMALCGGKDISGGDVECPYTGYYYPWVFQIKDCNHYAPHQPVQPTGKDTLCVNTDSTSTYTITPAANAWNYEWQLQPEEAGIITGDSLAASVNWNSLFEGTAYIQVKSINDCGESTWSDSLIIQAYTCLGVEEKDNYNFRVYPNPATGTLIMETQSTTLNSGIIQVYNSTGSLVYSEQTMNSKNVLDVSNWQKGIYFVKLLTGDKSKSKKILVL